MARITRRCGECRKVVLVEEAYRMVECIDVDGEEIWLCRTCFERAPNDCDAWRRHMIACGRMAADR